MVWQPWRQRNEAMITTMGANAVFRGFWEAPYRPLFFAAFVCALLTVAWWPLGVWFGLPGPAFEPVVVWHVHELVFGFAAAAIGGYLLTALPGWTGRPPVRGAILKTLLLLWVAARLAMVLAYFVPPILLLVFNAGYFLLLAWIIGRQLLPGVYHKLGYFFAVIGLGVGEVLFLGATLAGSPSTSLSMVHALLVGLVMLMVAIATRAIPAFTCNWFVQTGQEVRIKQGSAPSVAFAQVLLVVAIMAKLLERPGIAYAAMIAAALFLSWNMRGWQSLPALSNPLLAALHLAYLWLPLGLIAIGVSGLAPAIYPMADALHAITIGGMSGLIMAMAGRAAAHTESGDLQANAGFISGVLLVWTATWVRLAAPLFPEYSGVLVAGVIWCAGWIAFTLGFLPALTGPLRRPALSGRRHMVRGSIAKVDSAE